MATVIADTSPSRTALAIRHLGFEDLGLLGPLLHERGRLTRYLDVATQPVDTALVRATEPGVVLGGPVGAADGRRWESASLRSCRPVRWARGPLPARHARSATPR